MTDAGRPPGEGRRSRAKGWVWVVATVVLACAFAVSGLGDPLRSLVAAAWLVLLPALSATVKLPPADEIRAHRTALYLNTIVVLGVAGTVTLWLSGALRGGAGIWLDWPAPTVSMLGPFALLMGAGVTIAYLFRGLSGLFGWQETETVRAIMPVSRNEKGVFVLLTLAAGTYEEIVFRGFLPAFLMPWVGSYLWAALPVSVAFGILHGYQDRHGMVRTGVMGLVLAAGVAWTGSLWPSILAHVALNLLFGLVLRRSLLGGTRWT